MAATFPKPGPTGPAGSGAQGFVFNVDTPSSDITVAHNLNRELVDVTAYDVDGNEVVVGVAVRDSNTVIVTTDLGLPFTGKVLVI